MTICSNVFYMQVISGSIHSLFANIYNIKLVGCLTSWSDCDWNTKLLETFHHESTGNISAWGLQLLIQIRYIRMFCHLTMFASY